MWGGLSRAGEVKEVDEFGFEGELLCVGRERERERER